MLKKAKEHLATAHLLFQRRYFRDSISRSYYAVYSAMRACVDNPPKGLWDHSGLRKRFTFHLHMKGVDPVLSRKFSRDAAELYALRRAADYFDALVEEEEARRALFKAEEIVKFVEAL